MFRLTRVSMLFASAMALAASQARAEDSVYPPWSHGANNPANQVRGGSGMDFTITQIDDAPDFHGNPQGSLLNIFVGGNYFFAMAPLVKEFVYEHPAYAGRIYYETIPPGRVYAQIKNGGLISIGNLTIKAQADVYAAGMKRVQQGIDEGVLIGPPTAYATNTLTIMLPKSNPKGIKSLNDLAGPDVRLAMPDPKWEGIARQIQSSLVKAGGEALNTAVYDTKVKAGSTTLTQIHHRQTPLWLMQGKTDAGVTWQSEAIFQEQAGHPIMHVDIPAHQNTTAIYAAGLVKAAVHKQAGRLWLQFLRSAPAQKIFHHYGFKSYEADIK
ncbi:MAG: substrate-binding domain-containing protein [Alphaproteobacteria bacterium]|nr:substrate-binding domain-containing protein [Alphaproteobacteria bacterium]